MKEELKTNACIMSWSASKIRDEVVANHGFSHQRALMIARSVNWRRPEDCSKRAKRPAWSMASAARSHRASRKRPVRASR
jgi:hypothetical protein